jgi:fimbrial chaperone protein
MKASFQIITLLKTLLLNLLAFCLVTPVYAGAYSVTPVRIYMTQRDKATAVTINNEGDEDLVMQADVYSWMQKPDGEDDLVLTEDLLLSPPIIKVPAKSHQVVRLAKLHSLPQARQLTYRMIVREIPEAKPAKERIQIKLSMAFSIPIFITPPEAKSKLDCVVERTGSNKVNAVCENTGSAYAQPLDFVLTSLAGDKLASRDNGGYILPAIKRRFDIKSDNRIPAGKAKLTVRLDDAAVQAFDVMLAE